jgi:N-acetylneuraminate synthase
VTSPFSIAGRDIGPGHPVYIVAELSANHGGSLERALATVRAAKDAGADAVKLQTYTPDTITLNSQREFFRVAGSIWDGKNLHDLYQEAFMPWEWQPKLKEAANDLGMDLFSTPFDETAVDFLEEMDVPAFKIASFELVDLPLIRRVAATGKPVILSTGMATLEEISEAVEAVREARGASQEMLQLALLRCTSAYPADPEDARLQTIPDLMQRFSVPVGLSDHTMGIAVPVAAVALGACIVEKHFTLRRADGGPDSAFSLEPGEFKDMVGAIRTAERAMRGPVVYAPSEKEDVMRVYRPSIFAVTDIKKGERFTSKNVRTIRPGHGLAPKHIDAVIGREAASDLHRGTPLRWEHVVGGKLQREPQRGMR